ncbi:hypothetical protein MNBD_GAMMA21-2421 [hydrothermal vent metagenome]|uniref:Uncharacterized protein n=1 Tax=hydrothermal vent metagenome TaxID=652676 RepID=A0A3B1A794_9ZZZZ
MSDENDKDAALNDVKAHLLGAYEGLKQYYDENVGEAVEKFSHTIDDKVSDSMDDMCDTMILFSSNLKKKIKERRKAVNNKES